MDVTHIPVGEDGRAHLAASSTVTAVVGYEFALRGRAREAEGALETAAWRASGPSGRPARRRRCDGAP
jgi:putative transposase